MAVESVAGCAWNGWSDHRGIGGQMLMEWVVGWPWNPQAYREHGWKTVLDDPDSLKPLYAACMGRFGVLIDFLSHAETDNSRKLIDMKCLAKAYAHGINHQPFSGNPFSPSTQISEQELNAEYVRVLQQAHLPIPKL